MASLYLHIPFCETKCIYCDFYSIENHSTMNDFVGTLKKEIDLYAGYGGQESFETIFFGGGTPSLLAPETIGDILNHLHATFRIDKDAEITMESNPGTVDLGKLQGYRSAGVNRFSFGVQSFFPDDLKFLSRIHSAEEAKQGVRLAHEAGFRNINIDLIFALPGQTMERWKENLRQSIELGTHHISAYSLIVEENTPLFRMVKAKQVSPLPLDTEAEMYEATMAFMAANGFEHYEVSNYAKPGFSSRHNCNYWNHANYLGFGPSAHSFWKNRRWWNVSNISSYIKDIAGGRLPVAGEEQLTKSQLLDETIMLGLRSRGMDLNKIQNEFNLDLLTDEQAPILTQLISDDLAVLEGSLLRLTDKGFLLCDEISERLMPKMAAA